MVFLSLTDEVSYSLAWGRTLLDRAASQGQLDYTDLPLLDHSLKTDTLYQKLRKALAQNTKQRPLWLVVVISQPRLFVRQWGITLGMSLCAFIPQFCLLKILQLLESRAASDTTDAGGLWWWVAGLAVSKVAFLGFDAWYVFV